MPNQDRKAVKSQINHRSGQGMNLGLSKQIAVNIKSNSRNGEENACEINTIPSTNSYDKNQRNFQLRELILIKKGVRSKY